nr:PIN domain-containing protein [uncultured Rhodopila sp.]
MASDGTPPVVLYDANVLYPFHLRNLLVQLAVNDIVEPRWTDMIHDEWIRNVAATGAADRDRLLRTRDIMKRVLPGADVTGYEPLIDTVSLPDPGDRHVLAAAIAGGAEAILTFNVRHFPAPALEPFGISCREPDAFLCELYDGDPEAVLAAADAARLNLSRTAPDQVTFLEAVVRQRLPDFAQRLRRGWAGR